MKKEKTKKKVIGVYLEHSYWTKLVESAKKSRRSLSTECAVRLEQSLTEVKG